MISRFVSVKQAVSLLIMVKEQQQTNKNKRSPKPIYPIEYQLNKSQIIIIIMYS